MKSIVLLRIGLGEANYVCSRLKRMRSVLEMRSPFGRYDAAIVIQGDSLKDFWDVIRCDLQTIDGIIETFPCLIEDDQSLEKLPEHLQDFTLVRC